MSQLVPALRAKFGAVFFDWRGFGFASVACAGLSAYATGDAFQRVAEIAPDMSEMVYTGTWLWAVLMIWHYMLRLVVSGREQAFSCALGLAVLTLHYDHFLYGMQVWASLLSFASVAVLIACATLTFRPVAIIAGQVLSVLCIIFGIQGVWDNVDYWENIRFDVSTLPPLSDIMGEATVNDSARYPDIFIVVMDGYGGEKALKSVFNFDNSSFMDGLRDAGFRIVEDSRSSYSMTMQSVSSMLNMNYVQDDLVLPPIVRGDRGPLADYYMRPRSVRFLKKLGYDFANVSHVFELDFNMDREKDRELRSPDIRLKTSSQVLRKTPVYQILTILFGGSRDFMNPYYDHASGIQRTFEELQQVLTETGGERPRFVYGHVLQPHPPFVFNEKGEFDAGGHGIVPFSYSDGHGSPVNHLYKGGWLKWYRTYYPYQILYANRWLGPMMRDGVATPSGRPRVIILVGDHGERMHENFFDENSSRREAFRNLIAVHYSDGDYSAITPGMDLINVMRATFNKYYGLSMPMLPHKEWYARWSRPHDFTEVPPESAGEEPVPMSEGN